MSIMQFLLCIGLAFLSMPTVSWIPDDNPNDPNDSTPLTEEQEKAVRVCVEEMEAQIPIIRKVLFERYHKMLLPKDEKTFFSLVPLDILGMVLEYRFPLKPQLPITVNEMDVHKSYGVPGVCCCSRCN